MFMITEIRNRVILGVHTADTYIEAVQQGNDLLRNYMESIGHGTDYDPKCVGVDWCSIVDVDSVPGCMATANGWSNLDGEEYDVHIVEI